VPRYRLIPTGVPTSSDLQKTLTEMGLRNVEVHASPVPLDDWIGRPTDVMADVVVRRKDLGASSDDMGFVRNERGTYDALVSEIHLFRFDKKWFAELAQRTGVEVPTEGPRQFAASITSPLPPTQPSISSVRPTPTVRESSASAQAGRDDASLQRARLAAGELLEKTRQTQRLSQLGCASFFLPALVWFAAGAAGYRIPAPAFVAICILWTFAWFLMLIVVFSLRFRARVRELAQRFPKGSEARAAAISQLRTVADDKKNQASGLAARMIANLESDVAARLRQRPTKPHGPGASKP
jgi:hypothetical protein